MDVFLGHPELGLMVIDITYPSHILDTVALGVWLRKYRDSQVLAISGVAVYKRVSETIGLDNKNFYHAYSARRCAPSRARSGTASCGTSWRGRRTRR